MKRSHVIPPAAGRRADEFIAVFVGDDGQLRNVVLHDATLARFVTTGTVKRPVTGEEQPATIVDAAAIFAVAEAVIAADAALAAEVK